MFFPEGQVRVVLYGHPVSMRLSFDGLYRLASHVMLQDPLSGNLFASINRVLFVSASFGPYRRNPRRRYRLYGWRGQRT